MTNEITSKTNIQKITSKGQITLPASWRKVVQANQIVLKVVGDKIEITPARLADDSGEYTVFDAIRDNEGRGLKVADLRKMLKNIDRDNG